MARSRLISVAQAGRSFREWGWSMRLKPVRGRCHVVLPVRVHAAGLALALLLSTTPGWCGPYVTETSGVRWNDASGVRWNDASGVRWNDASGLRWNETAGLVFADALSSAGVSIDLTLLDRLSATPDTSAISV